VKRFTYLLCALVSLVACGSADRDAEGRASEPVPEVVVEPAPERGAPSLYDDEGQLLASHERVAGLTLPVGLTPNTSHDRDHTYLSEVPIAALLRYFGPRLTTGQVEPRPGGGASYRAAVPREVTSGAVRINVTLTLVPRGRVLIEIEEIPPEPTTPAPEAESVRQLTSAMQTSE
jgi:hypothetical protein